MADDKILHQDDVEEVVGDEIEEGVGKDNPAIEDVDAPGAVYAQAEATAAVDAINDILAVLRANGLIETE